MGELFSCFGRYICNMWVQAFQDAFHLLLQDVGDRAFLSKVQQENPYFLPEHTRHAVESIRNWFKEENLKTLQLRYPPASHARRVGIIMAGNVPLVGLHDLIATLVTGHSAWVKPSHKDKTLIEAFVTHLPPTLQRSVRFVDRVEPAAVDFLLATGSGTTARQLNFEFQQVPKCIRANRFSVAVLNGLENFADWDGLQRDMLQYHGMGCRSVSNLIVPVGYDLEPLVAHWEANPGPVLHEGWARLVAWERSILQMQGKKAWSTPQCVFQHVDALAPSRPGVVHVVECPNGQLDDFIRPALSGLQVVVGHGFVSFGSTQCPGLFDFADGVDTFGLLANI